MAEVLLVIDAQRALFDELVRARGVQLLETLGPLVDRARSAGVPVVYVRHDGSPAELVPGTPAWQIADEIAPRAGEPVVEKRFGDAFAETTLAEVLAALDADRLVVAGMQTDVCIHATIGGAVERGYGVTLVEDGHATSSSHEHGEQAIREEMHRDARARGVLIVPAAELFT